MDSVPPAHGPAHHLDDLLVGLDDEDADEDAHPEAAEAHVPEVAEAVTGRARDLHRLADRLGGEGGAGGVDHGTLSAVALLRAHAGAVDELAEHLLAARAEDAGGPAPEPGAPTGAAPSPPRGVPRTVG